MISVTKIFNFEMAHALFDYKGPCGNIHGHSYVLHVTVKPSKENEELKFPGFVIDFKELKELVKSRIIERLDHQLVLSGDYIKSLEINQPFKNLLEFDREPTAENLLLFISKELQSHLPAHVILHSLKLYETNSSYAEWVNL